MITYQVSITIQKEVEKEWLHWMKTAHVPDVIATGLVRSFRILKPLDKEQMYVFHYDFETQAAFDKYQEEFGPSLREDTHKHFPGKFTGERTMYDWI